MEKITDKKLNEIEDKVAKDEKYRKYFPLIKNALTAYKDNNNKSIVVMKIALIDLTNGTNLARNLGKRGMLDELAEQIMKVNFDERVKEGDWKLVNELAEWTKDKKNIGKNLFSFISKYCAYHNIYCYDRDDFMIYDL